MLVATRDTDAQADHQKERVYNYLCAFLQEACDPERNYRNTETRN
jgi:hypothetical protein